MAPISALGLDVKFRQQWEFRDGRSELSSDNSQSDNDNKPQERDSPASQLPSPEDGRGKDHSSSLMARKACKSRVCVTRKVKSANKKWPDFVKFGGMASGFDISISDELQVHMRSVLEDLDAERRRMSTWMREEMEKMSANGVVTRGQGKNGVLGRSRTRKSAGRSKSEGPSKINICQMPRKDGNNGGKQKAADPKCNIGHDSARIPLDIRNSFVRPVGRGDLREISSSGTTAGMSNEQSLMYNSPPNGFLNYAATIPTCFASPFLSNGSNCSVPGIRPTNQELENVAATHPFTSTYQPIPLLVEGVPPARGQLIENFWSNLTNSMVARFE